MLYKLMAYLMLTAGILACSGQENKREAPAVVSQNQTSVQGSAPITDRGIEQARQAAINDAIANAALQLKRQHNTALLPGDIKVVDEWQDGNQYRVQAVVVLSAQPTCPRAYRKKILATAFPLMHPDHVSGAESQDLTNGIPREINNHLMETGHFIGRNMTSSVLYQRPELAPEVNLDGRSSQVVIFDLAKRNDAQFILSGVIRDLRMESTEYTRGSGVLALLKSSMRDFIARRSVGIDVFVHDGFTGALLFQHRYTDSILGDVSLPVGYTVGSERFAATSAGHKITEIIDQASEDVSHLLGCYPFATRVIRVDGQKIHLSAGSQDQLKPGDRFKIYTAGTADTAGMGFSEPIASMTLTEVGPSRAIGQLDGEAQVHPGDWVRSFAMP